MQRIPNSHWKRIYTKLKSQINEAYNNKDLDMFPSLDEIERLASLAQKSFGNSRFYNYLMSLGFELRDDYIYKRNRILRDVNNEIPEEEIISEIPIDEKVSNEILNILRKDLNNFDGEEYNNITVTLNNKIGLVKCNLKVAFDWTRALITEATEIFKDISVLTTRDISAVYDGIRNALNVSINENPKVLERKADVLSKAFEVAMNDSSLFQIIDKTAKKLKSSREVAFLKLLETEKSIRGI